LLTRWLVCNPLPICHGVVTRALVDALGLCLMVAGVNLGIWPEDRRCRDGRFGRKAEKLLRH